MKLAVIADTPLGVEKYDFTSADKPGRVLVLDSFQKKIAEQERCEISEVEIVCITDSATNDVLWPRE
jgi:hypothetical protein